MTYTVLEHVNNNTLCSNCGHEAAWHEVGGNGPAGECHRGQLDAIFNDAIEECGCFGWEET